MDPQLNETRLQVLLRAIMTYKFRSRTQPVPRSLRRRVLKSMFYCLLGWNLQGFWLALRLRLISFMSRGEKLVHKNFHCQHLTYSLLFLLFFSALSSCSVPNEFLCSADSSDRHAAYCKLNEGSLPASNVERLERKLDHSSMLLLECRNQRPSQRFTSS